MSEAIWAYFPKAAAFHAGPEGKVIAIEADSDAVARSNRSCVGILTSTRPSTVVPVAVSDTAGFLRFSIAKRARSANSIEGFGINPDRWRCRDKDGTVPDLGRVAGPFSVT